ALLELGGAGLGVVSLPVLRGLEPAVGHLYRALHGEGAAFALARFALLFALLIPPTALMGATLPVLVAHFDRGVVGPALARLYALNTFGAVAGSIAGGFALLPGIGLAGTTWVAAGLNAGAALLAAVAGGAGAGPMERARGEPPAPAAAAGRGIPRFSGLADRVYALGARSGPSWGSLLAGEVLTVALLLLGPCALLGAVFPIAARLLQRRDGGHAAGFAYAVNTAGTLAGSLAAGFVLVPALGVQGTHVAALAISGAIGLIAIALARRRRELGGAQLGFGPAAAAVAGAAVAAAPRWDPALMSVGPFRPAQAATLS